MQKVLSNILLSSLTKHAEDIIGDQWYGFRSSSLSTDNILCIGQILKTEWEHSEIVHQVFIGFKNAFDSDSREVLYNIHIVVVILACLVILTKCV